MRIAKTENLNVLELAPLITPRLLKSELVPTPKATQTVIQAREAARKILSGRDRRLLVVVGPCSIHDPAAALGRETTPAEMAFLNEGGFAG
jgi:3-deoxy-7-phosphoheptulonate synthase